MNMSKPPQHYTKAIEKLFVHNDDCDSMISGRQCDCPVREKTTQLLALLNKRAIEELERMNRAVMREMIEGQSINVNYIADRLQSLKKEEKNNGNR